MLQNTEEIDCTTAQGKKHMIDTAVFGGAFDPVHDEHIAVAAACVKELKVRRVILVPTFNPPHKHISSASFEDRVKMLKIAFANFGAEVIVSEIEHNSRLKNYSSEILPRIKAKYGDFYYIIGGDSLLKLESWNQPEFLAANFKIAVFNREGYGDVSDKVRELNAKWNSSIIVMNYRGKDMNSHTIRNKIALDMYDGGVPDAVMKYIKDKKLYRDYDDYLIKLPSYLSQNRLIHSKNTAYEASVINSRCALGLNGKDVIIAGLLHDVGKKYDYDDKYLGKFDIPADSLNTPVKHQFVGAIIAKKDFEISNGEILDAIRYHTTGRPDMTMLEKLIYCADMLSPERDYPQVQALRHAVYDNFEQGFKLCLRYSYKYLTDNKRNIYPLTIQAINYYKEKK